MKKLLTFILITLSALAMTACGSKERLEQQEAYKTLGMKNLDGGEYEEAVVNFDKALAQSLGKITGTEIEINYYKGLAQYLGGEYDDAIETYTNIADFLEDDPDPYFLRGSVYLRNDNEDAGVSDYRKAVELSGVDYDMYIAIYNNLSALGYDEEADEFINEALSINKKNAESYLARGRIYLLLEEYDRAAEQLQTARDKGAKTASIYLAEVYQATGATDAARELLTTYLSENEATAEALSAMSTLSIEAGDYEDALDYVTRALAMENVDNKQALMHNKIVCEEHLGDYRSAYRTMKEYLELYPGDKDAKREYKFIKTRYEGMADTDADITAPTGESAVTTVEEADGGETGDSEETAEAADENSEEEAAADTENRSE